MVLHPRVDEQHAGPALHDNGVALHELAFVNQHALRDLPQPVSPSAGHQLQPQVSITTWMRMARSLSAVSVA